MPKFIPPPDAVQTDRLKSRIIRSIVDPDRRKAAEALDWKALLEIKRDFQSREMAFGKARESIASIVRDLPGVHSVRSRVKDADHLVEKCVRKMLDDPKRVIDVKTYRTEIDDLVGVRALHLVKREWKGIHDGIVRSLALEGNPVANYRKGDSEAILKAFEAAGCEIKEHARNYRSVHYVVRTQLTKDPVLVEIQVRTLFEEGWAEVDHRINYPQANAEPVTVMLGIFNRVAGMADEMSTSIDYLNYWIAAEAKRHEEETKRLIEQVESTKMEVKQQKEELIKSIKATTQLAPFTGGIPGSALGPMDGSTGWLSRLGTLNIAEIVGSRAQTVGPVWDVTGPPIVGDEVLSLPGVTFGLAGPTGPEAKTHGAAPEQVRREEKAIPEAKAKPKK